MKKKYSRQSMILTVSIILNAIFILGWLLNVVNRPSYKYGILTENINAGLPWNDTVLFHIPKGTTVKDVSPRGINTVGRFEGNRFEIVITSERDNLVNYSVSREQISRHGNHYSADKTVGVTN